MPVTDETANAKSAKTLFAYKSMITWQHIELYEFAFGLYSNYIHVYKSW